MAQRSPAEIIDAYRRRQGRRFPFTLADASKALLLLFILASSVYISINGGPDLPTLIELKTNTPTLTPSMTPTASRTATITRTATNTSTPTWTLDPAYQCNCPSPAILVVTATFAATKTLSPVEIASETPPITNAATSTVAAAVTPTPTGTLAPTATQFTYIVQRGDTLGGIALRFGVTVEALQALNNLANTMIYVGQALQIPQP